MKDHKKSAEEELFLSKAATEHHWINKELFSICDNSLMEAGYRVYNEKL